MRQTLPLLSLAAAGALASGSHPPIKRALRHRDLAERSIKDAPERRQAKALDAKANPGGFVVVGDSGVSAQMMFLGTENTVYILDSE